MIDTVYVCYFTKIVPKFHHTWIVTIDKEMAKNLDPNHELATLQEVYEWSGLTGEVFPKVLRLKDGDYIWKEDIEYHDGFSIEEFENGEIKYDIIGEYVKFE